MIGKLSASVMRIDGGFEDWKDVKVCAYDPKGDAKDAFDITKVYAASQGCAYQKLYPWLNRISKIVVR
jgi:hypothetical protein